VSLHVEDAAAGHEPAPGTVGLIIRPGTGSARLIGMLLEPCVSLMVVGPFCRSRGCLQRQGNGWTRRLIAPGSNRTDSGIVRTALYFGLVRMSGSPKKPRPY